MKTLIDGIPAENIMAHKRRQIMKKQWNLALPFQGDWFHVGNLIQAQEVHEQAVEYSEAYDVKIYCFFIGGTALWRLNAPQKLAAVGWWLKDKVGSGLKVRMFVKDKAVATVGSA